MGSTYRLTALGAPADGVAPAALLAVCDARGRAQAQVRARGARVFGGAGAAAPRRGGAAPQGTSCSPLASLRRRPHPSLRGRACRAPARARRRPAAPPDHPPPAPPAPQYLFNVPEGFARLLLEHRLRPGLALKAAFAASLSGGGLVRRRRRRAVCARACAPAEARAGAPPTPPAARRADPLRRARGRRRRAAWGGWCCG